MIASAIFAAGEVPAGAYRATLRGEGIRDSADNPLANDHHLDLIFVPAGEALALPDGAMVVNALSIGGTLDVGSGAVIVNYGSVSPVGVWTGGAYDGVGGMIQQGRIISSAASGILKTVAVAEARDALNLTGAQTTTFAGQAVDSTSVLIKLTWGGDANLDGKINIDDYGRIDGNVSQSGSVWGWFNGDFNYDGKINIDDYGIIDGNINQQDQIL
jgi:cytoskeletal protein CcmA (bactofilin family)